MSKMKEESLIQLHHRTAEGDDTHAENSATTTSDRQEAIVPHCNDAGNPVESGSQELEPTDEVNTSSPDSEKRQATVELLRHQLVLSAPFGHEAKKQASLRAGAVELYNSVKPENAIETNMTNFED